MKNGSTWLGFYGAAGGVTGSRTLITAGANRVLVDCGLFQGTQEERLRNWQPFPFDHTSLSGVVLTHAHLDHSGGIPLLHKRGYRGPVFCTPSSAALLEIMLEDSGKLQEEEAAFRNKVGWSKHHPALPLYTMEEAKESLRLLRVVDFGVPFHVGGLDFTFHRAAHIIGSASVTTTTPEGVRLLFSGDIGRGDDLLLGSITERPEADVVICEGTYGDRRHPDIDRITELETAVEPTLKRRGVVLLPAFAVGRAQELLVALEMLFETGRLERCPVYLDSPMATKTLLATESADGDLSENGRAWLRKATKHTKCTLDANASKALNDIKGPAIIVASSGMLTGGRILHHLMNRAGNKEDSLILTGFQARGTRGRRIADGEPVIKLFGQPVTLELEVNTLTSFSAHADQSGLVRWLGQGMHPQWVIVNHAEHSAAAGLVSAARTKMRNVKFTVASPSEKYSLEGVAQP